MTTDDLPFLRAPHDPTENQVATALQRVQHTISRRRRRRLLVTVPAVIIVLGVAGVVLLSRFAMTTARLRASPLGRRPSIRPNASGVGPGRSLRSRKQASNAPPQLTRAARR